MRTTNLKEGVFNYKGTYVAQINVNGKVTIIARNKNKAKAIAARRAYIKKHKI